MNRWEELNEARQDAWNEAELPTESARVRAVVLALLYIGDCIRYLAGRPGD